MKKAVDTLNSVFTAFLFSQIYALLFSEGEKLMISDAFCTSKNWNRLLENQCDNATETTFRFSCFPQLSCFIWYLLVLCSTFR